MNDIKSGNPVSTLIEDKLNRTEFAKHIANIICQISVRRDFTSIVFGLYGKWGDGKTSLINFIKEFLSKDKEQGKEIELKNDAYIFNKVYKIFLICLILDFHFFMFLESIDIFENFFDSFGFGYYAINPYIEGIFKTILILYIIFHRPFKFNWLINMLRKLCIPFISLFNKKCVMDNSSGLIIADFAPWNIANKENVVREFFLLLRNILKKDDCEIELDETLRTFDDYVEGICNNVIKKSSKSIYDNNILTLKAELEEKLKKRNKKFLIFIDDIDRLSDSEIVTIFQLVKSLANLPNIIYFLSFDKQIVSKALDRYHDNKGEKLLEKIIQIPFEVPKIEEKRITDLLCESLQKFIENFPEIDKKWDKYHKRYWQALFYYDFFSYFKNVRDVERFINTLIVNYNPSIHNEINFIDFLVINAFQLFNQDLYFYIKNNPKFFTTKLNDKYCGIKEEEKKDFLDGLYKILGKHDNTQRPNYEKLVLMLFPNIDKNNATVYPVSYESTNERRKNGRICCIEHFSKYFTLSINNDDITLTEMYMILDLSSNQSDFSQKLLELNDKHKIKVFLERLEDFTKDDIAREQAINIIKTLFDIGDFFEFSDNGFWTFDIYTNIIRIVYQLLDINLIENKFEVLKEAIYNPRSLYPSVDYIQLLISALNKEDGGVRQDYVIKDNINILVEMVLREIYTWKNNDIEGKYNKTIPFDGSLIRHRRATAILYFWFHNGDRSLLEEYVSKMTENAEGLLTFLKAMRYKVKSSSGYGYKEYFEISGETLANFFNLDSLIIRLDNLDKTSLSTEEKELITMSLDAISQFNAEKNKEKNIE